MREPRPTQRFPVNGKDIYEGLRRDYEPILLFVVARDEAEEWELQPYRNDRPPMFLVYERNMDPMLYFWPVEGQHVWIRLSCQPEEKSKNRLVRALTRDGADWISITWPQTHGRLHYENHGDAEAHMNKRGLSPAIDWRRYSSDPSHIAYRLGIEATLDSMAIPGRGSGKD